MPRPLSKIAPDWWDYTTLEPELLQDAARLEAENLAQLARPGFRVTVVTLATTLLDAEAYPAEELAEMYHSRWQVEVDLRRLKTTLKMDVLRCQAPEGVLKELTLYAVAYDLVRMVMLEAGRRQGVSPSNRR